jgi:DNA-binding CsgD family transcriptional regulator
MAGEYGRENSSSEVNAIIQSFARYYRLSQREASVLNLFALGLHRKESAFQLGCSPGTVDTYWRRIFRKTGTPAQSELFAALLSFAVGENSQGSP